MRPFVRGNGNGQRGRGGRGADRAQGHGRGRGGRGGQPGARGRGAPRGRFPPGPRPYGGACNLCYMRMLGIVQILRILSYMYL